MSWWELPEEDQPPEEYWGDDDAIKEWFAAVRQKHKDRMKRGGEDELEEVPMNENEWARGLPGGR